MEKQRRSPFRSQNREDIKCLEADLREKGWRGPDSNQIHRGSRKRGRRRAVFEKPDTRWGGVMYLGSTSGGADS